MKFNISQNELNRRKIAFVTLLLSLSVGIIIFLKIFGLALSAFGYSCIGVIFILLSLLTFHYLESISKMIIIITDNEIERMKPNSTEKYLISDIDAIRIKRRTNGIIREISIRFKNHKQIYINGFEEDFENIKSSILNKLDKEVNVKDYREPMDYDHPLFYPVLGLLISFTSIFFLKFMISAESSLIKFIMRTFSVFDFLLAIYFVIKNPISIRSGKNQKMVDYIFGIVLLLISVCIFRLYK